MKVVDELEYNPFKVIRRLSNLGAKVEVVIHTVDGDTYFATPGDMLVCADYVIIQRFLEHSEMYTFIARNKIVSITVTARRDSQVMPHAKEREPVKQV